MKHKIRSIPFLRSLYTLYQKSGDRLRSCYYQWKGEKVIQGYFSRERNFGDLFNKDLLAYFGFRLLYCDTPVTSDMALTGSILQQFPREYKGFIMGSGFIKSRFSRKGNQWKVRIIRGPLSAKQCGATHGILFGDPGILASRIYPVSDHEPNYILGIIPHYKDHAFVKQLSFPDSVLVINVRNEPAKVAAAIQQCAHIVSSSLHGLIFADAFGIPNSHVRFGDRLLGGNHKFEDYYLGMNSIHTFIPYEEQTTTDDLIGACSLHFSPQEIRERQDRMIGIFRSVLEDVQPQTT